MYLFFRKLLSIFFHIKYKITVVGEENIPKELGGYVIACNHQFYSDPPMIAAVIRGRFSFMAKSELFKNPVFAWIIRRCGAFPVVRGSGDNTAIETAISSVKKNRAFVIFPEGTRSKDGTIQRGKSGVALIASMADAPVLPVCIVYGEKHNVTVAIGKMISRDEMHIEDTTNRKELRRIVSLIMDNIIALQKKVLGTDEQ